jgi:hypothetical protein
MSVVIAMECTGGLDTFLKGAQGFGVALLTVGQVRTQKLGVVRYPDPELPGHAHVVGKKTKSVKKHLYEDARLILEPALPENA